jgi:hypothetical protein
LTDDVHLADVDLKAALTKYLGGKTRQRDLPRCATTKTLTRRLQENGAGTGVIHPPDELLRFILNGRRLPQGAQKVTLRANDDLCLVLLGPLARCADLRGGAKKDTPAFGTTLGGLRQGQLAWLPTTTTPTATGPAAAVTAPDIPIPIAVSPAPLPLPVPASYPVLAPEDEPLANAELTTNDGLSLRAHDHASTGSAGRGGGGAAYRYAAASRLRAAGMPEPRSASPPARTGKKRDGDECSDLEELQPPPAKLPAVRARPVAKQNADGSWPCMSSRVWGPRTVSNEARNDLGEIDADGLWRFVNDRQKWRRDRKAVKRGLRDKGLVSLGTRDVGLVSLGTRKAEDPEVKRAWEERHEQMVQGRRASRGTQGSAWMRLARLC